MERLAELTKRYDDSSEQAPQPALGKVLVIDDDPHIRQGVERTLRLRNNEVIVTIMVTKIGKKRKVQATDSVLK